VEFLSMMYAQLEVAHRVATVGSTMAFPEKAWPRSSGGFSQYFPRPNYPDGAVLTFLEDLGNQYAGLYKCVHCRDLA
jgi:hypothetical protein